MDRNISEACKSNFQSYEQSGWERMFKPNNLSSVVVSKASAAVLIPIFVKNDKLHVLLTRRSHNLRTHKGEVSFPGGKRDQQDASYIATALRETTEEIGISSEDVEVLATWEPDSVIGKDPPSIYPVYPVIGLLRPGFKVVPNIDEVSEVFDVPLEFFLEDKTHRAMCHNWLGVTYWVHNYAYTSELRNTTYFIWGFTGRLCLKAAVIALKKLPSFEVKSEIEQKIGGFVLDKPVKPQRDCFSKL